ncbi:unnamed protein product [Rhizoctonia solani]|uniref:DNA polymerase kappa n=1 Tax=Rhizoctonia solani TaxID=456999 RepID=A0A8H3ARN3_9AGAM|nr:unnamed protein product [Rhizoctonia solani]
MEQPTIEPDSLLKRLSGPSSGKAGLAKDQTEINKIIAEVSKGSKFYENEKRKDAELTVRVEKLLALRDDLMKNARIAEIKAVVDKQLAEIELQRDFSQVICHADMDAFYATVETLDNPSLEGTAFGVGIGVLSTASYEARKFGVRSGMATFVAKALCPHLNLLPMRFHRYTEMSDRVFSVLRKYDPNLLAAGCDEGYLNLTVACKEANESPEVLVQRMREEVSKETGLTMSCGVAPNKALAKVWHTKRRDLPCTTINPDTQICSDLNKPNGQYILAFDRSTILDFTRNLPMRKMPGTGRVTERILDSLGTCGDLFTHRAQLYLLSQQNKLHLHSLLCAYLGVHDNTVAPYTRDSRRSLGYERTFHPQRDSKILLETLDKIAEGLAEDCEKRGWAGKTLTLKYKLDTYQSFSRAKPLPKWAMTKEDILPHAQELLLKEFPLCLRLMGLRLTNLKDLREDSNTGLKRFWVQGPGTSKAGNMKPIDEESDTDSELGLWEVNCQGEPVETDSRKISKPASTSVPATHPAASGTKEPIIRQGKLTVSRGSVPLERSSAPKRKRSVSVGANPPSKSSDGNIGPTKKRRESLPPGSKTTHKIIIDVDSLCPDCLQEIEDDHQHSARCPEASKGGHLANKNAPANRGAKPLKQPKLTSLFSRKRS